MPTMAVAREKFLLQLDHFQLETPEFWRQLWEEKDLTDVTLDRKQMEAQKFTAFLSDPSPIIAYACHLLTDSLTPV